MQSESHRSPCDCFGWALLTKGGREDDFLTKVNTDDTSEQMHSIQLYLIKMDDNLSGTVIPFF